MLLAGSNARERAGQPSWSEGESASRELFLITLVTFEPDRLFSRMQSCCSCSCTRPLSRSLATPLARRPHRTAPLALATRAHSTASKPPPGAEDLPKAEGGLYPGHVPINLFQRGLLTVGSAVMGLIDTSRHGAPLCIDTDNL